METWIQWDKWTSQTWKLSKKSGSRGRQSRLLQSLIRSKRWVHFFLAFWLEYYSFTLLPYSYKSTEKEEFNSQKFKTSQRVTRTTRLMTTTQSRTNTRTSSTRGQQVRADRSQSSAERILCPTLVQAMMSATLNKTMKQTDFNWYRSNGRKIKNLCPSSFSTKALLISQVLSAAKSLVHWSFSRQ